MSNPAFSVSTGTTAIPYGATLKIGYRRNATTDPFVYLSHLPTYNELPYIFQVTGVGSWEIQYITICPICTGNAYSESETVAVTVNS